MIILDKVPVGAPHVAVDEFPVKVPITVIWPPEQTVWFVGLAVTPVKLLTSTLKVALTELFPHALKALTVMGKLFPGVAAALTETVILLVKFPDVIVNPAGKLQT